MPGALRTVGASAKRAIEARETFDLKVRQRGTYRVSDSLGNAGMFLARWLT